MTSSVPKQQCGITFDVDGDTFVCSLVAGHAGGHGRIDMLTSNLRFNGLNRAADDGEPFSQRVVELHFNRTPTDDELRALHVYMRYFSGDSPSLPSGTALAPSLGGTAEAGHLTDESMTRCADCKTPRLCGVERECLHHRYVGLSTTETPKPSNRKNVPDFFGRLYPTDLVNGSFLGTWVRRAEVDALLDEIERLHAMHDAYVADAQDEYQSLERELNDALGVSSGDGSQVETSPHLSSAELLIPATRYYIGRMTIHTTVHAQALARGWSSIPQNVRNVIRTDLEDAFRRDDAMRADPVCSPSYYPLGGDVDREAWEEVRKAWLADPSVQETKPESAVQTWVCLNCKSENRDDYHRISCPGCGRLRPAQKASVRHLPTCNLNYIDGIGEGCDCGAENGRTDE